VKENIIVLMISHFPFLHNREHSPEEYHHHHGDKDSDSDSELNGKSTSRVRSHYSYLLSVRGQLYSTVYTRV